MSLENGKCDRCGASDNGYLTGSYFNTDMICPVCEDKERAHPNFNLAREREAMEVRMGNFNFKGIGKPADL
jgi:hypothetical protein